MAVVVRIAPRARRDKEHSTIIYESPQPDTPLLRLGWNKQDPRYMATLLMDSPKVGCGKHGDDTSGRRGHHAWLRRRGWASRRVRARACQRDTGRVESRAAHAHLRTSRSCEWQPL